MQHLRKGGVGSWAEGFKISTLHVGSLHSELGSATCSALQQLPPERLGIKCIDSKHHVTHALR